MNKDKHQQKPPEPTGGVFPHRTEEPRCVHPPRLRHDLALRPGFARRWERWWCMVVRLDQGGQTNNNYPTYQTVTLGWGLVGRCLVGKFSWGFFVFQAQKAGWPLIFQFISSSLYIWNQAPSCQYIKKLGPWWSKYMGNWKMRVVVYIVGISWKRNSETGLWIHGSEELSHF